MGLRLLTTGLLPLLLAGTAVAQQPVASGHPSGLLTLDQAAERMIGLCLMHASGSRGMDSAWQRVFPGRPLARGRTGGNGWYAGAPYIDGNRTRRLSIWFEPNGECMISANPSEGPDPLFKSVFETKLAKSQSFVPDQMGDWILKRPDQDLQARANDRQLRINPVGRRKNELVSSWP